MKLRILLAIDGNEGIIKSTLDRTLGEWEIELDGEKCQARFGIKAMQSLAGFLAWSRDQEEQP